MGWVYLIKNGDLHKIGRTDNLKRRIKQLQPCVLIEALETNRSRDIEYELQKRFRKKRLPQSEYFRLNQEEVDEVRRELGWQPTQKDKPQKITLPSEKRPAQAKDNQIRAKESPLQAVGLGVAICIVLAIDIPLILKAVIIGCLLAFLSDSK